MFTWRMYLSRRFYISLAFGGPIATFIILVCPWFEFLRRGSRAIPQVTGSDSLFGVSVESNFSHVCMNRLQLGG
jgi:hypothetical protein